MFNLRRIQRTSVVNSSIGDNGPLVTDVVEHRGDDHSVLGGDHHLDESLEDLVRESAFRAVLGPVRAGSQSDLPGFVISNFRGLFYVCFANCIPCLSFPYVMCGMKVVGTNSTALMHIHAY